MAANVKTAKDVKLYEIASDSTDYQALMDRAVSGGDYRTAAEYEQKRNAKIDAMDALGMNPKGYSKSNLYGGYLDRPSVLDRTDRMTAADIEDLYRQMGESKAAAIDASVQSAVDQLERAKEDAQKDFDARRTQTYVNEAQNRDRQVLYAAARGDRGGITARQYDSIANTAANARLSIDQQRQQLAADTAQQVADLRAQGAFKKADALLQITQQQLSQLWEMQKYEDSTRMAEDKLAMQQAGLTGIYNGQKTFEALQEEEADRLQAQKQAYQVAMAMIESGQMPSDDLLASAGMLNEKSTYQNMANLYHAQMTAKAKTSSGSKASSGSTSDPATLFTRMMEGGIADYESAYAYLSSHKNNYSDKQVENNARNYLSWLQRQQGGLQVMENVDGQLVDSKVVDAYVRLGMIRKVEHNGRTQYHWAENVAQ